MEIESVLARVTAPKRGEFVLLDGVSELAHARTRPVAERHHTRTDAAAIPASAGAGIQNINIKPQYDEWKFPDGYSVMVLAEGRLLNPGCATGHPSFVMSASFSNQTIAQLELYANRSKYEKKVYILPKLTQEQADYLGGPVESPYKPEHYRY